MLYNIEQLDGVDGIETVFNVNADNIDGHICGCWARAKRINPHALEIQPLLKQWCHSQQLEHTSTVFSQLLQKRLQSLKNVVKTKHRGAQVLPSSLLLHRQRIK